MEVPPKNIADAIISTETVVRSNRDSKMRLFVFDQAFGYKQTDDYNSRGLYEIIINAMGNDIHNNIRNKLKKISFMRQIGLELLEKAPLVTFDTDKSILKCNNGILDFKIGAFREITKTDYCLLSTNLDYSISSSDALKSLNEELSLIFPIFKNNQDFIDNFTACLVGHRRYDGHLKNWCICNSDYIKGNSGKSLIEMLVKRTFGTYCHHSSLDSLRYLSMFLYAKETPFRLMSTKVDFFSSFQMKDTMDRLNYPIWFHPDNNEPISEKILSDFNTSSQVIEELKFTNRPFSNHAAHYQNTMFNPEVFLHLLFTNANSLRYVRNVCNCHGCVKRYVSSNWEKIRLLLSMEITDLGKDIADVVRNLFLEF